MNDPVMTIHHILSLGPRARAALDEILVERINIIRWRYDPTIPLTPETRAALRGARRVLRGIL